MLSSQRKLLILGLIVQEGFARFTMVLFVKITSCTFNTYHTD